MPTVMKIVCLVVAINSCDCRLIFDWDTDVSAQTEGPNILLQRVEPEIRRGQQRVADEKSHRMSTLQKYMEYDIYEFPHFVQMLHRHIWTQQFPTGGNLHADSPVYWPPLHNQGSILHQESRGTLVGSGCNDPNRRFLVFSYGFEQGINGFAAMFQFYAGALLLAHRYGMTLVELLPAGIDQASYAQTDPWRRAPLGACNGLKMGCFLAPSSACALSLFPDDVAMDCGLNEGCFRRAADIPRLDVLCEEKRLFTPDAQNGCHLHRIVQIDVLEDYRYAIVAISQDIPAWFAQKAKSWACKHPTGKTKWCHAYCNNDAWKGMWFAAFEAFLFRPLSELLVLPQVEEENRIGLHVRRGDTVKLAYRYHGDLDAYLPHVQDATHRLEDMGVRHNMTLFLASDSSKTKKTFNSLSLGIQNDVPVLMKQQGSASLSISNACSENATEVAVHIESWINGQNSFSTDASIVANSPRKNAMRSPISILTDASFLLQPEAAAMDEDVRRAANEIANVTRSVIADIWELSRSSVIIGTCFSQVGRIAYELGFAAFRPLLPPIGLDAAACMHPSISHPYKLYTHWYDNVSQVPGCP
jgi:hypothetical protein